MLAEPQEHNFKFQRNRRLTIEQKTKCRQIEQMTYDRPAPLLFLSFTTMLDMLLHFHSGLYNQCIAKLQRATKCLRCSPTICGQGTGLFAFE